MILSEKQKKEVEFIESLPRRERRTLGKKLKVKIPGSSRPLTKSTHGERAN